MKFLQSRAGTRMAAPQLFDEWYEVRCNPICFVWFLFVLCVEVCGLGLGIVRCQSSRIDDVSMSEPGISGILTSTSNFTPTFFSFYSLHLSPSFPASIVFAWIVKETRLITVSTPPTVTPASTPPHLQPLLSTPSTSKSETPDPVPEQSSPKSSYSSMESQ